MSRRDSRDSDSRRHRSRFDREPSPKRSRRGEKDEKDRIASKGNLESGKQSDQDQKQRQRLQDTLPLESTLAPDSKGENGDSRKESNKKPSGPHEGTKHSTNPSEIPRSRSYFQHNERGNAGQVVRSSGRGSTAEHGSWRDPKDRHDDRTVSKTTTNDSRSRNEKAKAGENRNWRHDGFFEMEADPPSARKRPAFREKKIPVESDNADKTAAETAKSSHPDPSMEGSRKKEDRGHNPRHTDRSDKQFAGERGSYRRDAPPGVFPSRERYTGGAGRNNRGRDGFSGRQGYNSSMGRAEKWTHDLYNEANRSPTPKNEEDQIAKVEALLAS
ncbi:hypothetical protein EV1_034534 [Malus domestica]